MHRHEASRLRACRWPNIGSSVHHRRSVQCHFEAPRTIGSMGISTAEEKGSMGISRHRVDTSRKAFRSTSTPPSAVMISCAGPPAVSLARRARHAAAATLAPGLAFHTLLFLLLLVRAQRARLGRAYPGLLLGSISGQALTLAGRWYMVVYTEITVSARTISIRSSSRAGYVDMVRHEQLWKALFSDQ